SSPARSSLFLYSSPPPLSPLPLHDALPLSDPPDGAGRAPSLVGRLVGSLDALRGAGRTVLARRAEEARSDRSRHPVLLVPGALPGARLPRAAPGVARAGIGRVRGVALARSAP